MLINCWNNKRSEAISSVLNAYVMDIRRIFISHLNVSSIIVNSTNFPSSGTTSDVGGIISANRRKNTVNDNRMDMLNDTWNESDKIMIIDLLVISILRDSILAWKSSKFARGWNVSLGIKSSKNFLRRRLLPRKSSCSHKKILLKILSFTLISYLAR